MQKSEAQHQPDQQPSTKRTGKSAAPASPQGQQIAQLESMAENSPQSVEQARIQQWRPTLRHMPPSASWRA